MPFLARATAFILGLGIAGIALFGLGFRFPHAWMPLALGAFMALVIGYSRWTPKGGFNFFLGTSWVAGTFALWMLSSNVKLPIGQVRALAGLYVFVALAVFVTCGVALALKPQQKRIAVWLIWSLFFGLVISYMSGPPGRLDVIKEILARIGAEDASLLVRKAGHFVFYGLFAWVTAKASLAAGNSKRDAVLLALAVVIAAAAYDELRQSTHPMRVGSPYDVAIDLLGALTFLSLTKATKGVRS